jgi:DNA-binding IclR family transcriptional regulator
MGRTALKGSYTAPAIEKAFEIIDLLAYHPEGALVSEMATHLGRSVGELFRIVIVLERLGYLRKSARNDRYTVTYKLLDTAFRATPAQNLLQAALPEMQTLASEVRQSCHFVVPSGGHGTVIAVEQQPGPRGFSLRPGAEVDMITTCSGQVLLAFSAPDRADQAIGASEEEQGTRVDHAWLTERLAEIRERGYDCRKSPITLGVTDISFPVFGFDRRVAGALTVPFLELHDGSLQIDLGIACDMVRAAATRISDTLGYSPQ